MNTTLNINRIGLLLKRYFIENKQHELRFWIITTVVFMVIHKTSFAGMFLIISGFILASNSFNVFSITPNGIHYLLILATHAEKMIVAIVINTFYFFIMFLITYIIGTTIGSLIGNFIFSLNEPVNYSMLHETSNNMFLAKNSFLSGDFMFWKIFTVFASSQSIFMLGSIFFKRNAAIKTISVFYGFSIAFFIIEIFLLKLTIGSFSLKSSMIGLSIPAEKMFSGFYYIGITITYLLILFFWIVAYFRLTEKQV
jgi:hypothetical protein